MTKYRATLAYNRRHRVEIEFEASNDASVATLRPALEIWARATLRRDENTVEHSDGYVIVDRLADGALDSEVDSFELDEGRRRSSRARSAPLPRALGRASLRRARLRRRSRPA